MQQYGTWLRVAILEHGLTYSFTQGSEHTCPTHQDDCRSPPYGLVRRKLDSSMCSGGNIRMGGPCKAHADGAHASTERCLGT
jgi:hypothetical protein